MYTGVPGHLPAVSQAAQQDRPPPPPPGAGPSAGQCGVLFMDRADPSAVYTALQEIRQPTGLYPGKGGKLLTIKLKALFSRQ